MKSLSLIILCLLAVSCSKKRGQTGEKAKDTTQINTLHEINANQPESVRLTSRNGEYSIFTGLTHTENSSRSGQIYFMDYGHTDPRRDVDYFTVSDEFEINEIKKVHPRNCDSTSRGQLSDSSFNSRREVIGYEKARFTRDETKARVKNNSCYAFRFLHEDRRGIRNIVVGSFFASEYTPHRGVTLSDIYVSSIINITR